jgi:hypothetical protein
MPDSSFLDAQLTYESLGSLDVDAAIARLDSALSDYSTLSWKTIGNEGATATVPANSEIRYGITGKWVNKTLSGSFIIRNDTFGSDPAPGVGKIAQIQSGGSNTPVETAFAPIAEYYTKLVTVNEALRKYLVKAVNNIAESEPRLTDEERYTNRVHPEESTLPRETLFGLFPELKITTLPYLLSASVFMAFLSIFLIFQMNGFAGQLHYPPIFDTYIANLMSPAQPTFTATAMAAIVIPLIIFATLYIQSKNINQGRQ